MEETTYIVYVTTDANGNITAVNSSAFLPDTIGWIQIDEGTGDKYHHAQGNYFDGPLMTPNGIYRYTLFDGSPAEKTAEAIAAEQAALPQAAPTTNEQLALLADTVDTILTVILPALG
jgi:hypothetical protein